MFPVPNLEKFSHLPEENAPGRFIVKQGEILLNPKKNAIMLTVTNQADRPIQVFIKKAMILLISEPHSLLP